MRFIEFEEWLFKIAGAIMFMATGVFLTGSGWWSFFFILVSASEGWWAMNRGYEFQYSSVNASLTAKTEKKGLEKVTE